MRGAKRRGAKSGSPKSSAALTLHTTANPEPKARDRAKSKPTPDNPTRGVFEEDSSFPGIRNFHVISSTGEKRLEIIAPSLDTNERLMEFMEDWLDRIDPLISLIP